MPTTGLQQSKQILMVMGTIDILLGMCHVSGAPNVEPSCASRLKSSAKGLLVVMAARTSSLQSLPPVLFL
jgi:hypothetical protein